jgi:hypothetical protein
MTAAVSTFRLDLRQCIKLVVYALLLVNFALYIADDLHFASYTMRNGGSFLQWTAAFATTIDEAAWFILLFLFELETYVLSDDAFEKPWVARLLHGVRLICYLSLAHSVYAFGHIYLELMQVTTVAGITELCQLVAPDVSFVRNLAYTELTMGNCEALSSATQFYYVEPGLVMTDASGLALERALALVDVLEVITWMAILFTIEVMVRLQERGITRGHLVSVIKACKFLLYTCLWGAAAFWVYHGHYYYAWDEALWIIGFFAIEMNVQEWKNEIESEQSKEGGGIGAADK